MRAAPLAAAAALVAALVLTGWHDSPGSRMRGTVSRYLDLIEAGDTDAVRELLQDSLGTTVPSGMLPGLEAPADAHTGSIGRPDNRGWPVEVLSGAGARTIWLTPGGSSYRVSADTAIDALEGAMSVQCMEYVLSTVLPAVSAGADPSAFTCPVSGAAYGLDPETGALVCPAGHLGSGLVPGGDRCASERAEAAAVVYAWTQSGNPLPADFAEVWEGSGGTLGRPGGYRCPDQGYSYYEITPEGIRCPYHEATTPFEPEL